MPPLILADLRAGGETISRKTVAATMRRLRLVGISPKICKTTTIINHTDADPIDAVKRQRDWRREPGLGRRRHLPADVKGVGLPRNRHRRPQPPRHRVSHR